MKLSETKERLSNLETLRSELPNGKMVPSHWHMTEVGKINKSFITKMKNTILPLVLAAFLFAGCSQNKKGQENIGQNPQLSSTETPVPELLVKSEVSTIMYPRLSNYIESTIAGIDAIPRERKDQLRKIALFVKTKKQSNEPANLTFICTHNSRRSHMSQIWAATAAAYFGVQEGVQTYSGGTETTAFNPRAVAAIERAGFMVDNPGGENPHYKVTYAENAPGMECFSKKYDDRTNPQENFVAIMTCSEADKNCPFIPGASLRVPIPYVDPKEADGTEQEAATYDERCRQIAAEMFYIMSQVKA